MSGASFPSVEIPYRPSRYLIAALLTITVLAAAGLSQSAVPALLALLPLPLAALASRSLRPFTGAVLRFGQDGTVRMFAGDGGECGLQPLELIERGPLVVLTLRRSDGKRDKILRLCFAPDTLPTPLCRKLRLWWLQWENEEMSNPPIGR